MFGKGKIDFNRQGLYPSETNREDIKTIKHIRLLFEGKKKRIITELKRDMIEAAKAESSKRLMSIRTASTLSSILKILPIQTIFLCLADVNGF